MAPDFGRRGHMNRGATNETWARGGERMLPGPQKAKGVGSKSGAQQPRDVDHASSPTAYLLLPGELKQPLALSGGPLSAFAEIEKTFKVTIEGEQDNTVLRVTGASPARLKAALRSMNDRIRGLRSQEASAHRVMLVQPAGSSKYPGNVIVVDFQAQDAARPTLIPNSSGPDHDQIPGFSLHAHKYKTFCTLRDCAKGLEAIPCDLQLRVKFGLLRFQKLQHTGKSEYGLRDFMERAEDFVSRGVPEVDTRLGGKAFTATLLDQFKAGCYPYITTDSIANDRSSHTLTLLSKGEQTEADIVGVWADNGFHQHLSNLRRFEHDEKRVEVISACPHLNYDWSLDVVAKRAIRDTPRWVEELGRHIVVSIPPGVRGLSEDAVLKIERNFVPNHVEATVLKTSVKFQYPETPYEIDFSIIRQWPATNTGTSPETSCTLSLYCTEWDERMNSGMETAQQRCWGPDLQTLFSGKDLGAEEVFSKFMDCVLDVQEILNHIGAVEG